MSTPFKPSSYEVTRHKGSLLIAQRGSHQITRNVPFLKRVDDSCMLPVSAPHQPSEAHGVLEDFLASSAQYDINTDVPSTPTPQPVTQQEPR